MTELRSRAEESMSTLDPMVTAMNQRLLNFANAIHFAAADKRSGHSTAGKSQAKLARAKKVRKEGEEGDDPVNNYEFVEEHKTCSASGKLGKFSKKVKAPEDCFTPCAEEPGCIAFVYYQKPQKMCELFSACGAKEDVNIIRGSKLYGIMQDGEITTSGSCGKLPQLPNAKPANFQENVRGMSHVSSAYLSGDEIKYKCKKDHTTDGSKEGAKEFKVACSEQNYYKPEKMGCIGASECGPVPCVRKAHITGKREGTDKNPKIELVCDDGYSLDGEKVVPGGNMKNALLYLECDHAGQWQPPVNHVGKKGKVCTPFAFVPASGMIKMYNKVFAVLFVASCNTELTKWAEMKEELPPKLDDGTVCGEYVSDDKEGDCSALVDDLKTLFEDAKGGEIDDKGDQVSTGFDAKGFCQDMWDLLKMDEPAAKTEC
jgi:hypothetical protein